MLLAARAQARQRFEANRTLDPQSIEYTAALQEAEGVSTILRQNVVQGSSGGDGEKFSMSMQQVCSGWRRLTRDVELRIHEETERGDNDTVKGASAGQVGGVKCCSS